MVRQKYGAAKIWRGRAPRKTGERMFRPFSLEGAVCEGKPPCGKGSAEGGSLRGAEACEGKLPHKRNAAAQKERRRAKETQREPKGGNFYPIFKKL